MRVGGFRRIHSKAEKVRHMAEFLRLAREERRQYERTRNLAYLQQAGNKLWNAYIFMLEAVTGVEITAGGMNYIRNIALATRDKDIKALYYDVMPLHIYYYEPGYLGVEEVLTKMRRAYKRFAKIRKRYNLYA